MTATAPTGGAAVLTGAAARGPLRALRRCTAVDPDTFAADVWGRRASLSRSQSLPGDFADLFSLDVVDRLVSVHGLRTPFLRVAKDGETLPAARFTRGGGTGATIGDQVADDRLARLFADGCTVVLQGLHRTHEPLLHFAQELSGDLGHPVQVNAYVTPPQSQGFSDHYDVHDVFVLQVAGRKRWILHEPVVSAPSRDQVWTDRRAEVAAAAAREPLMDVTLEPGDALYLPRGFIHAASALGGISAHLTIGIHTWTASHVLDEVMRSLREDPALRRSLPFGIDVADPAAVAGAVTGVLDTLARRVAEIHDDPGLASRVAAALSGLADAATRAEPVPPMRQSQALARLGPDTRLRLRRGLRASLRRDGDTLTLVTAECRVELPVGAHEGARRLLAGETVTTADLAGEPAAAALLRQAVAVPAGG